MEGGGDRTFALLGSGEFEPWAEEVDRWLLSRARRGRVLILPTASAPEGDEVFDRWGRMGLDHYARQTVDARVVPVRTRADAARPDLVAELEGAAVVFFSGGNPGYLAETLKSSPFWRAVVDHLDRGMAYAGCSAGANALGERATWRVDRVTLGPGLRLFPRTNFAPHWDAMDRYIPGLKERIIGDLGDGATLVGIEERTAMVGDGRRWSVIGTGGIHVLDNGAWREAAAGQPFVLNRSGPPRHPSPRS